MHSRLKHFLQESWLLIIASFFFGLLIAVTDAALAPRIEQNRIEKFTDLAKSLLPQAEDFVLLPEPLKIGTSGGKTEDMPIYQAVTGDHTVGWVFTITGYGFADKIDLVVAVDGKSQAVAGYRVLFSNETPNFGDQIKGTYFRDQFAGAPAGRFTLVTAGNPAQIDSTIVAITGATISSTAVIDAFNHYLPQVQEQLGQKGMIGDGNKP
ncbi:MAG: FMN-binding protein [Sedimentisphaerales bacterium]|nr:FMN-binding protein [Sedimentisphaerales bacterium]